MSETMYLQYVGDVTPFGANAMMQLVSSLLQKNCQHIHINISSKGGCNQSALTVYNFLRHAPCKITTHNIGYCDSAANILYLAGSERIATPHSRFVVHSPKINFNKNIDITSLELLEQHHGLAYDETLTSNIFLEAASIDVKTTRQWMFTGKVITPPEAVDIGLATSIANFTHSFGAEIIFVNTTLPT